MKMKTLGTKAKEDKLKRKISCDFFPVFVKDITPSFPVARCIKRTNRNVFMSAL